MARLPKSIIKKYGISKKAWRVFKGRKLSGRKRRRTSVTRKVSTRRGPRKMARRRTRTRRRKGFGSGISGQLMGAGGVVLYESLVSPRLPLGSGITKNAVEFGIGYFLRNKGGFLGSTGKALMTVNAVELVRGLLGGGQITQTATTSF